MISTLIRIGVHEGLTFKEQSKLRIFNLSVLVVCLIMVLYTVMSILQGVYIAAVATTCELGVLSLVLYLNSRRWYQAAFHLGISNALVFVSIFMLLFGKNTESHIFFIFIPVAALIVFENPRTALVYFLISMLLLATSRFIFRYYDPIFGTRPSDHIFALLNFLFTGLLIFMGVRLFKTENLEFTGQINHQNKLLEEKNKDITDSINYAQRIQKALLASDHLLDKGLKNNFARDYFILFKPKDIVSGDFYWVTEKDGLFFLAVCDSTGHGVPGAFMSLLNISFMNEAIAEKNISSPEAVFNHVRQRLIENLSSEGAKDGMDGILVSFKKANNNITISYASAHNAPLLVQNGIPTELSADNMPVGAGDDPRSFSLHTVTQQPSAGNNFLYLYTDGYADQFGGPKGKKFKYKTLKQLLIDHSDKSMAEQKEILASTIENWKGNLEQVDDILIIGIHI